MRIGFDAREMGYRGIGTYSRNLLFHFAATDIEFVVFCQDEERDTFLPVDSFTFVSANMNPLARHSRSAFHRLVEKSGVDLLHVPSPWAPTPSPVPLVATIHDVTPLLYPRSLSPTLRMRYKRQLSDTLDNASRVITVSNTSRSALSAFARVDPAKVRVICNGVSEKFYPRTDQVALQEMRRKYSLPEKYAFWAGDFRPEKNLPFLVQGWARLKQRLPDLPALVLAGYSRGAIQGGPGRGQASRADRVGGVSRFRRGRRSGRDVLRGRAVRLSLALRGLRIAAAGGHGLRHSLRGLELVLSSGSHGLGRASVQPDLAGQLRGLRHQASDPS